MVNECLNALAVAEVIIILGGVGMIVLECLNMFKQGERETKTHTCDEYMHSVIPLKMNHIAN